MSDDDNWQDMICLWREIDNKMEKRRNIWKIEIKNWWRYQLKDLKFNLQAEIKISGSSWAEITFPRCKEASSVVRKFKLQAEI